MAVSAVVPSALTASGIFLNKPKVISSDELVDTVIRQLKDVARMTKAFGSNSTNDADQQYMQDVGHAAESCQAKLLSPSITKHIRP